MEVDTASLSKPSPVRIQVACKDPSKIGGTSKVYINHVGYNITWLPEMDSVVSYPYKPDSSNIPVDDKLGKDLFSGGDDKLDIPEFREDIPDGEDEDLSEDFTGGVVSLNSKEDLSGGNMVDMGVNSKGGIGRGKQVEEDGNQLEGEAGEKNWMHDCIP
ncbi:hypothetical protein GUJ93_ZPchr0006g46463 [Zizania palustris]|uniref:Uncharacterized protein n=1 Tax=Zizania palustris TaxID=103762 RepID=A0A8J5SR80_ZIZPA|nr:hypothetical protein GUJ93_ZPchr0006g46463 [Zizania palustris]